MLVFYLFLMSFVIVAALIAVETKNLLSAVICIGAAGFGGSLMFLFMKAPDIAITQIAVEVLGLIILIRATIARDKTFITGDREFFAVLVSVAILVVVLIIGVIVFNDLPEFGTPAFVAAEDTLFTPQDQPIASQAYIEQALKDTGAANIVASVILDFRAYDTLGEATVLFTSILGAVVILRKNPKALPET